MTVGHLCRTHFNLRASCVKYYFNFYKEFCVYFGVVFTLNYNACRRSEDLTDRSIDDFHCVHELIAT